MNVINTTYISSSYFPFLSHSLQNKPAANDVAFSKAGTLGYSDECAERIPEYGPGNDGAPLREVATLLFETLLVHLELSDKVLSVRMRYTCDVLITTEAQKHRSTVTIFI